MMEKAVSLFFLLFSILYFIMAHQLSFGTIHAPKAGFLPVLAGLAAIVLAAVLTFTRASTPTKFNNWRKLLLVLIGLLSYTVLLPLTGYPVTTFFVVFYLLKVTDTAGWLSPFLIALCTALIFTGLFAEILNINLP